MWLLHKRSERRGGGLREGVVVAGQTGLVVPDGYRAPKYIDGRALVAPRDDQGQWPCCAACAETGAHELLQWRDAGQPVEIPFLPVYRKAKALDANDNPGTTLEQAHRAAAIVLGVAQEPLEYVHTAEQYRLAIHSRGFVVCGFRITDGWNRVNRVTGYIADGKEQLGGHAVLGCGFDGDGAWGANSWGNWGWQGFWRLTWRQFEDQLMYGITFR